MKAQEAVEELLHGASLGGGGTERVKFFPGCFQKSDDELLRVGGELCFCHVRFEAEGVEKFQLECENISWSRRLLREMVQEAGKKCMNFRHRAFGFSGLFDQGRRVAGLLQPANILAQGRVGLAYHDFTQRVQFGAATALKVEVGLIE